MSEIFGSRFHRRTVFDRFRVEDFWWVGAALAGVLVAVWLPRLVLEGDVEDEPFPRDAEHAEV